MKWTARTGLVLAVAAALATPLRAQVGRVSGVVTDPDGKPLKDVLIRIEGMNVKRKYKVKTNKKGKFIHAGVAFQGTYRVIAIKEGYQSQYLQGVRPTFDDKPLEFVMQPGKAGVLAFEISDEQREKMRKRNEQSRKKAAAFAAMKASFNQGVELYKQGQYQPALELFKKAAARDENQSAVWAYLGNAYDKLKQPREAINSYEKAISLSPENSSLYQNLGNIYANQGDTAKAKEWYEKAAQLTAAGDPKAAATTYYNMGVTYINAGKNKDAAEALEQAVKFDPSHAEAHYQLGIVMLGLNRIEEAVVHFKKYLELAPAGPNAETAKALVEQLGA